MSDSARAIPDPAAQCPITRPSPIGSTISTTPIRAGPKIRFRSGTNCGRHRPVVHTDRFLGCYMPTTYEAVRQIAHDTEHFSSRRVIVRDVRPEIDERGAADHLRPAGAQAGQAVAAAAVHARRHEEAGAAGSRDLQRADRRIHRRRQMRRRGALHQAHSGAHHRPHARHPGKGQRSLHQMDPRDPRTRHQGRQHADAGGPGDERLFRRPYRAAQETPDRRSDLDADERQGQERPAAVRRTCAGLAAAAPDRRHRHHLERDRRLAVASGEDAGGSRRVWSRSRN